MDNNTKSIVIAVIVFTVILLIVINAFLWLNNSAHMANFVVFTIFVILIIFFVILIYCAPNENKTYDRKKCSNEHRGNNGLVWFFLFGIFLIVLVLNPSISIKHSHENNRC